MGQGFPDKACGKQHTAPLDGWGELSKAAAGYIPVATSRSIAPRRSLLLARTQPLIAESVEPNKLRSSGNTSSLKQNHRPRVCLIVSIRSLAHQRLPDCSNSMPVRVLFGWDTPRASLSLKRSASRPNRLRSAAPQSPSQTGPTDDSWPECRSPPAP